MNHAVIANQSADWCGDPPEFQEIATSGFALLAMTGISRQEECTWQKWKKK